MSTSLAWEENFPKGYGHTSISYLKRCPGFDDAKKGDLDAARFVVLSSVKQERICSLREQYPDAILIPVLGRNLLPLALAQIIGLPIWTKVFLLHSVSRKRLCAFQRLLQKPIFTGVIQSNTTYILVDDVITQGGTIAALREFVIAHGGKVVAVVALAYAIGSHAIAPKKWNIVMLLVKFGARLLQFLQILGIASTFEELTNMQARYLLRFASIRNIAKKLVAV